MNADEFHVRLLGIRGICKEFKGADLSDTQKCYLGAELQELAREIIEEFALRGYRRRD